MFLFRSPMRHGYGAPLRSSIFGRALGRRGLSREEVIALTGDYRVARGAFDEAVMPGRIVTLRQKTRLLADSHRKH